MDEIIKYLPGLLSDTIMSVLTSLYHNWLPLSLAILTASLMKVYVNAEKLKQSLLKKPKVSIFASVAFGAFTPLCACGTMAVIIGLLTTALPWGPVMAFLTSSPLMSPDTFIMIAGILNVKFAIALTVASIVIGLISGGLTH
ncbi:MAG TPA: permease, partial [Clostridia bacterium]|nr:permease [Clostridia bacterium]